MGVSVWQILIVAVVVLVLFGRGRISEMMGDFGKGISSFKKGMTEDESASSEASPQIEAPAPAAAPAPSETTEASESTTDKSAS